MLANVGYIIIFLLLWVIGKKFNLNFAWELKVVVIFANPNLQKKSKAKKKRTPATLRHLAKVQIDKNSSSVLLCMCS